jgi:hypothetical protein
MCYTLFSSLLFLVLDGIIIFNLAYKIESRLVRYVIFNLHVVLAAFVCPLIGMIRIIPAKECMIENYRSSFLLCGMNGVMNLLLLFVTIMVSVAIIGLIISSVKWVIETYDSAKKNRLNVDVNTQLINESLIVE